MKRAFWVFITGMVILAGAISWEYVFDRQNPDHWVKRFERKLHAQEAEADEVMASFTDSVDIAGRNWEEDVIFTGFKDGELFFWTDKIVGIDGLYEHLKASRNFVRINNTYYDVRSRREGNVEYFALLRIKDSYPYNNKYVKDRFGKFLGIGIENADNIDVSRFPIGDEKIVKNKDGQLLFYIQHNENYKDRSTNYVLLGFYVVFFILLFYVYDILLSSISSLRKQLVCILGFILFLFLLRYVMLATRLPDSLYRLRVFESDMAGGSPVSSIGDLLMSAFAIIQVIYISFSNIKIDYQSPVVKRMRYVIVAGFMTLAFVYMLFFNYAIRSLIENTDVYLDIARVIGISTPTILAFVAVIMGGLGLLIIISGSVNIFKHILPIRYLLLLETALLVCLPLLCYWADDPINAWGAVFVYGMYILVTLSFYKLEKDFQRTLFMLCLFLLSIYIVLVEKKYEQYRELMQRAGYATELIEERDYNFEKKLQDISVQIHDSEVIADLVASNNEEFLKMCLTNDMLELNGYNYESVITLCQDGDSLRMEKSGEVFGCADYFNHLITSHGEKISHSDFYSIVDFDGLVSYIGKFVFGNVTLYLRFDSARDSEGNGYPQILSRKSVEGENVVYPYSYAKYKDGQLISSSGDFTYYKSLDRFGDYRDNILVEERDGYSHMLIPVDDSGVLVMSLPEAIFSFYYVNVLYAFFVCILLASYGLLFSLHHNINFRRGTLKARIKNSIISLIFILFVILTAMTIYLNSKSFQKRHNAKATELLKYINKELEGLPCVEYKDCPEILSVLTQLSEVLYTDINIYSREGELAATSRPEIFTAGFDGYLIDPGALKEIVGEQAMNYVRQEHIGELEYMSAYMPITLENGRTYILNVPYFTQNSELNVDIIIMVIIAINIAVVVMVLAFILSGIVAERVTKPLQLVNEKLKLMRIGGKNERIDYRRRDEVGELVKEYNNMVGKLEENVRQLARSERESAWREMARQIAHEIKNPLTPMRLNIQFMQRSLQIEDTEEFKKRFRDVSSMLIEQIDNMAAIASAFSDFAKMPMAKSEEFDISELVAGCAKLFENNIDRMECDIEPGIYVLADKEQVRRVFVNVLKNAVQSIPEEQEGRIDVMVRKEEANVVVYIRDNGMGIPEDIRSKVFEPNFTTKSSGTGLGLAISCRIIESMGGRIGFNSLDTGTEFYIILKYIK